MPMLPSPPPLPIEGGAGCGSVAIVLAQYVRGPRFNPKHQEWGWVSHLEPALRIQRQENQNKTKQKNPMPSISSLPETHFRALVFLHYPARARDPRRRHGAVPMLASRVQREDGDVP